MIGNPRDFHGHLKDVAEADDLLKQRVIFPLGDMSDRNPRHHCPTANACYSALQEMRFCVS